MFENIIRKTCSKVFKIKENEVEIIERLRLGMSNIMYLIMCNGKKYTFRIPGENADVFVDRNTEKNGLLLIEPYNLCGKTIYFDEEKSYKISEYFEGRVLYGNVIETDYKKVAEVLHKLHNIKTNYVNSYQPFETLEYYENLNNTVLEKKYYEIKKKLLKHKSFLEKQKSVLCHNDAQPSNFVDSIDGNMILLDYEFIGNNDPLYDVACFGNNDIRDGEKLLSAYLNKTPDKDESNRYYLWRTFQNIQWYLVALYKHELKMDQSLNMNFLDVAMMFLNNAEKSVECVK